MAEATERTDPPKACLPGPRLLSVDAFRGIAIAGMIAVERVADRSSTPRQLVHAAWNGLTLADLVFPLFLFAAGVSMALSVARHSAEHPGSRVWLRVGRRTLLLVLIGLALAFVQYGLPLRIPGVLQRIGLSLALAAPFVRLRPTRVLGVAAVLGAAHTAILLGVGVPGVPAGSLDPEHNIAGWIDSVVFGHAHLYRPGFDPEGLLGTLTSTAEVLCGVAFGRLLLACSDDTRSLARVGVICLAAVAFGLAMNPWVPVNKHLWTTSFVLVTSGIAGVLLVMLYALVDTLGHRAVARPFAPLGRNPLVVYVGSALLASMLAHVSLDGASGTTTAYLALGDVLQRILGPTAGSLAFSALYLSVWYGVAVALDRRDLHVRV